MIETKGRVITEFIVRGRPVPYSYHPSGFRNGQDMKSGKPNVRLMAWKDAVERAAEFAMGDREPYRGPVRLELTFFARTPPGQKHGSPDFEPLMPNEKTLGWKQANPNDHYDLTNAMKTVEDAVEGFVFENDTQVCEQSTAKLYGLWEGVKVRVLEFNGGSDVRDSGGQQ